MKFTLLFIIAGIILCSLVNATPYEDCSTYGTCKPESISTYSNITNINNTFINQTLELNSTQFETGEPATIKESWLTNFIEIIVESYNYLTETQADTLYCKLTGCTMNGNINLNNYNITANNLCYSNGSNCQNSSSTPIIAGFYFTNFSTYKSASQTFPCMENPVEYYNLTLLETPNSNDEVNINLTNGIITIPETGKYRVYYSVHGYFGTTTMLKEFGVYVNNVSKASYSPLFIRTPTTNLFLPYSQTEILSFNQSDNISIYLTNNGASATATSFYFHGLKLEVEKI